ncbi:Membrane proteins related to metalloendopeptidases [Thiothrix caldifontis]|uniref:Membrane proteins related to metalloendopeptidases n=1 Tax=Thiothrix caldifontis TaxID=525918 RepID=A0A1H4DV90_9GAMM|nr:conjugal transfer protein TraG N-terminal domain-containing protein [Thiothrix caldifontis]SEA76418.1 Membrane proteins related to metalloendopeptidases [Thiothrix caldifontis]
MNWEIYTYGGGEFLATVLNAVAAITQNSNYTGLLAVVAMIGLLWVIIEGAFGKEINYKWLLMMVFVYMGFMVPKSTVIVTDRINPAFNQVIANVPFGLAATAGTASRIGDYLTRTFDTVFALPDDLTYSKTGMLFGQNLMMASTRFQITDSRLRRNMGDFWQSCVLYDVLLGLYEWDELLSAPDTWEFLKANTSKARAFTYRDATKRRNVIECRVGATGQLNSDLNDALRLAKSHYGAKLGKGATASAAAAQFAAALPISYQALAGMSMSAEQTIRQNWLANSMEADGFQAYATRVDAAAAAQSFAIARAETERRTTYAVLGELAGRTLPLIRNIFEAFIYGIFPLVFALMLLPQAGKVVMTYIKGLLWLQLWAPLYAILHFGMTLYGTHSATSALTTIHGSALSLATNTGLYQALADMSLVAGYLSMSIPMISYLIVNQGGAMMAGLAGKVMGSYEAPAAKGAEEATTGNISLGNTSLGNANWWAQNTAPSTNSGTYTHTDGMGTKHIHTANGGEITQQAVSSYAMSANMSDAVKSSMATQAGQSVQAARTDSTEYAQQTAAIFSDMKSFSHQVQQSLGTSDTATKQQSTQLAQALDKMQSAAQTLKASNQFSLEDNISLLGKVAKGIGISGNASSAAQEAYNQAVDVAQQTGFKKNWQTATQLSSQLAETKQNGVSDAAAQNLQAGIQQNNALAEKAAASFQRAENWSQVQSRLEEHGISFSGNIDNAIWKSSGMSRPEFMALQQRAESGDMQAAQQLNGLVDRFVDKNGAALVGLQAAPTAGAVNDFYSQNRDDVSAQGQAGMHTLQTEGAGRVASASGAAGVDGSSTAPTGYNAIRTATQGGMRHDQANIQSGKSQLQEEYDNKSGKIDYMAHRGAYEGGQERLASNAMNMANAVVPGFEEGYRKVDGVVTEAMFKAAEGVGGIKGIFNGQGYAEGAKQERAELQAAMQIIGGQPDAPDASIRDELLGAGRAVEKKSSMSDGVPSGNPIADGGRISSEFGMRTHPVHGDRRMHAGIDIAAPNGTAVSSTAAGVVKFAGEKGGYGNVVILDHGNGVETRYAHLSSMSVKAGDVVADGDLVGKVGSTGTSTGNHLHYEVREDDKPVDPQKYLKG